MRNNLKIERAIQNITQAKLAEMIGVSRQTVNAMELNKYVPSTVLALKISKIFSIVTFFTLSDKMINKVSIIFILFIVMFFFIFMFYDFIYII